MPVPDVDLRLWGKSKGLKPPYPLIWHLLDTTAVALRLWDDYLTPNQRRVIAEGLKVDVSHARLLVAFWAGLHDLGKATPGFQELDRDAFKLLDDTYVGPGLRSLRHEKAAQLVLPGMLSDLGYPKGRRLSSSPAYRVAQILGGHHGIFRQIRRGDPDGDFLGTGAYAEQRVAMLRLLHDAVGRPAPPPQVGDGGDRRRLNRDRASAAAPGAEHPHMRGEEDKAGSRYLPNSGAPPRAWGGKPCGLRFYG
jgi:CRISPR-associated endonuclease/helicase Cas3